MNHVKSPNSDAQIHRQRLFTFKLRAPFALWLKSGLGWVQQQQRSEKIQVPWRFNVYRAFCFNSEPAMMTFEVWICSFEPMQCWSIYFEFAILSFSSEPQFLNLWLWSLRVSLQFWPANPNLRCWSWIYELQKLNSEFCNPNIRNLEFWVCSCEPMQCWSLYILEFAILTSSSEALISNPWLCMVIVIEFRVCNSEPSVLTRKLRTLDVDH